MHQFTRRIIGFFIIATCVVACGRAERFASSAAARKPLLEQAVNEYKRTVAYEHSIVLQVASDKVASEFASIQARCTGMPESCEVLDSRIYAGDTPTATLRLRATPKAIAGIVDALGKSGEVTSQSTSAEDLAVQISDGDKKLALKKDYRARLEALVPKASGDVDSLIKINKELAQVQVDLEEAASQSAKLAKRVNTELLNISFETPQSQSAWASLNDTSGAIARNFASGVAAAIATISFLLPWIVLLIVLIATYKAIRRFRRKYLGAKE